MNAGDIAQHLKVGKARLLKKIDGDSHGTEKWEVQFITGPHRNKGPLNIWIKEANIVVRAEIIETAEVAPVATETSVEVAPVATETSVEVAPLVEGDKVTRTGEPTGPIGRVREVREDVSGATWARVSFAGLTPLWVRADTVEVAPLVIEITPAMADMLSSHSGGSESLDAAQDAGVTWTDGVLMVPFAARRSLAWFLGMRAELAMENGTGCPSVELSALVTEVTR